MTSLGAHDRAFMATALAMASRGLGTTAPNPSVGCILVKDGRIVGRGWTQPGGRPHAETEALNRAGDLARGATAYVTLEPCCHHGETPPCTDALTSAGIARVVIGSADPDDRVDGGGIAALKDANIEVETGVLQGHADAVNGGYFKRARRGLPHIALKMATTMDGRIALASGESQWITGEDARRYGHLLRATYDAVLIGSGTALTDDPELTCRLPGVGASSANQPIRIVLDRRLRISADSKLATTANSVTTWVITSANADADKVSQLEKAGVEILVAADPSGHAFARAAACVLAEQGMTRVLVDGGANIAASFLQDDLVDRIYAFRAPSFIGGEGIPVVAGLNLACLSDSPRFNRTEVRQLGMDLLEILDRPATF